MMLMNARPRTVSYGFESIMPVRRVESLHQRLVEMTNNDINAWTFFKPGTNPQTDRWDQNLDDFNNENFPLHTVYSDYQNPASIPQYHHSRLQDGPLNTTGQQTPVSNQKMTSTPYAMYQSQTTGSSCVEKQSPMLSLDYAHWNIDEKRGSFSDFSKARQEPRAFSYPRMNGSSITPFTSTATLGPQEPYHEELSIMTDFSADTTSPSTAYSSYSSSSANVNPVALMGTTAPNYQDTMLKNTWWPENARNDKSHFQDTTYGIAVLHDGLPKAYTHQYQQFTDTWNTGSSSSRQWEAQPSLTGPAPITISPKALTLDVPGPSFSTSASSQGGMLSSSDASSNASSREASFDSGSETMSAVDPNSPIHQPRQALPESLPPQFHLPVLPSSDNSFNNTCQKRALKSKYDRHTRSRSSSTQQRKRPTASDSNKTMSPPIKAMPKRIEPKLLQGDSWPDPSQLSPTAQATHYRDAKDDFLVRSKLAGMSYKDIRRQGNFSEAESTLRGRFRTLTKHKTARVRKPEWTENDIKLLKKSVRKLTPGSDPSKNKVPWKQVAEYIANHAGSYHFGNATCRKRWDELQRKGA